ncbi:hypothetical protein Dimus_022591, partial [Dionaea muscipula]
MNRSGWHKVANKVYDLFLSPPRLPHIASKVIHCSSWVRVTPHSRHVGKEIIVMLRAEIDLAIQTSIPNGHGGYFLNSKDLEARVLAD